MKWTAFLIYMGVETRLRWPRGQEGGQDVRRQQAGAAWNGAAGSRPMEGDSLQPLKVIKAVHEMDSLFNFQGSQIIHLT
ncbi:hypothetical protein [Gracilinema caldarium]|uniref:hypothetical protein n=1 Tax=Gracilinema caldarium TaxID=215591 RepID=UPI0026EEFE0F|nr:hypothetical protein [Gracilinema caldarium]